ncbi:MAG: preprotein translocase subunit SecG [Endomicrobia bacterium]|nr:preprotein translocase subunit SecG [Endomicrobiia bacterium]
MYTIFYILHIIVCVLLVVSILLQLGQVGGFGGIFGGGVDQIFSSSAGSMFMKKVTIVLAIIFVITTIVLTILSYRDALTTVVR